MPLTLCISIIFNLKEIENNIQPTSRRNRFSQYGVETNIQQRQFIMNALVEQLAYLNFYDLTASIHQESSFCDIRICTTDDGENVMQPNPSFDPFGLDQNAQVIDYQQHILGFLHNFNINPYVVEY